MQYGFSKTIDLTYEQAIEKVTAELKKEGFGILTKIDLREKFKEKLGIDFKKYAILGACHPPSAHKAVLAEENIGLLLPCNVIIYEKDDKVVISVIKPMMMMQMIDNEQLRQVAETVEAKLKVVFDSIV